MLKGVTVGAGYFSEIQMESWRRVTGAAIEAVCDLDAARAEAFAQRHGIPAAYSSAGQMLDAERPAFVDIVTRPDSHLELTALAAERGIHVLCQKPMAPSYADCADMVECCQGHGVRLMINENWRWQRWYREIKGLLDAAAIGRPFYARFETRRGDGNTQNPFPRQPYFRTMPRLAIYETGVHLLDTFRFLFGEISGVWALTRRVHGDIAGEDLCVIEVELPGEMVAVYDANRYTEPRADGPAFGTLQIEATGGRLRLEVDGRIFVKPLFQPEQEHGYAVPQVGYRGDSCRATQQHFVDCLTNGREFETSGREYLKTVAAMFACYESARRRAAVDPRETAR